MWVWVWVWVWVGGLVGVPFFMLCVCVCVCFACFCVSVCAAQICELHGAGNSSKGRDILWPLIYLRTNLLPDKPLLYDACVCVPHRSVNYMGLAAQQAQRTSFSGNASAAPSEPAHTLQQLFCYDRWALDNLLQALRQEQVWWGWGWGWGCR